MFGWLKKKLGRWCETQRVQELEKQLSELQEQNVDLHCSLLDSLDNSDGLVSAIGHLQRQNVNAVEYLVALLMTSGGEVVVTRDTFAVVAGSGLGVDVLPGPEEGTVLLKIAEPPTPASEEKLPKEAFSMI